ncbi:unnamed protein product, partial [Brassica oleracea var. botrytis]
NHRHHDWRVIAGTTRCRFTGHTGNRTSKRRSRRDDSGTNRSSRNTTNTKRSSQEFFASKIKISIKINRLQPIDFPASLTKGGRSNRLWTPEVDWNKRPKEAKKKLKPGKPRRNADVITGRR